MAIKALATVGNIHSAAATGAEPRAVWFGRGAAPIASITVAPRKA